MIANSTLIDHFGEALRSERQRRSVSLEDISQTTKVAVRNLQALESDAFDQLPGGILSKGIVRSYVRFLGLDEREWVARFLEASQPKMEADATDDKDWASFAMSVSTSRSQPASGSRMRWAGVVALLLLLAGFGWFVWGYVHQRMAALPNAPATYSASTATGPSSGKTVAR